MTYKIFKRKNWKPNPSWPDGYEPSPWPADSCRTIAEVDTFEEAKDYCSVANEKWLGYKAEVREGVVSPDTKRLFYETAVFEFTEC